jgi:uncharacterized membrane protein
VLCGGYALALGEGKFRWWRPLVALVTRPAMVLAVLASLVWGLTPVAEKIAIQHSTPSDPTLVAFGSTALMAALLTPLAFRQPTPMGWVASHGKGFLVAACVAGVAPIFGFSAIALGLVGYVTALFKLSTVVSMGWAALLLRERVAPLRLAGGLIMLAGGILIGS